MNKKTKILLFLDFDGTISPIVKDPRDAKLPNDARLWLNKLARTKNIMVGIVTGRSMNDIRRRVGVRGIFYAANHGLEIYYKGRRILQKGNELKQPLLHLSKELCRALSHIPKVYVESKGLSVGVHFRNVKRSLHGRVRRIVRTTAGPWVKKHELQITVGKMMLEVRPARLWNKGDAVMWIWKKLAPRHLPVYIGDDTTDEDAFLALKPYGLTIRVGKKKGSHAEFFMNSLV